MPLEILAGIRPGYPGNLLRATLGNKVAAKAALEDAGANALDAVILQNAKPQDEKK